MDGFVKIDGMANLHRDMNSHAVININMSEYEAYLIRKANFEAAKKKELEQHEQIVNMQSEIDELKTLVRQLLVKDSNGTSTTS